MNARTAVRLTFANPVSAAYLTAVGGSFAVASAVTLFADDPGFVWVWPALFTMPASGLVAAVSTSLPSAVGDTATSAFLITGIIACGLVQSFALGVLHRSLRTRLRGSFRPRRG
ncbi:SCO4225 family membrane protein [Streptomyces sp. NPDC006285]|uniref:SCO4225 family membrane protein n=1 Tax=Streptomyces sp. NPDC006285 TaxID=3364742 RepID=UPI0036A6EAF1